VADAAGPFVRIVPKEAENAARLRAAIDDLFATKMPQIHRAVVEHLDASLRSYMWKFVVANWDTIKPLCARPDFVRLVLARLGAYLARENVHSVAARVYGEGGAATPDDVVHPTECWVKPPMGTDPMLGDLRVRASDGARLVVLWPSCDLVLRNGERKVERVLCVRTEPLADTDEYKAWVTANKPKGKSNEKLVALKSLLTNQRQKAHARHHFLPPAWDIPGLVVDFRAVEMVAVTDLLAMPCQGTVSSPFAESMAARFGDYLGRLGTPDVDLDACLGIVRE